MSFLGTIAVGAMAQAYNEDKAAKEAQVAEIQTAKRQWLFTTGMENIKNRRERRKAASARVSQAQRFGFSRKSAMALEMSGQLEFELEKLRAENVRLRDAIELYIEYKNGDEAMQEYFGLQNLKKALEGK